MKDPQTQYAHDIALFRYGVIAELVHLPPATKGLYARIAELAKRDYTVPGSERTRFAPETICPDSRSPPPRLAPFARRRDAFSIPVRG